MAIHQTKNCHDQWNKFARVNKNEIYLPTSSVVASTYKGTKCEPDYLDEFHSHAGPSIIPWTHTNISWRSILHLESCNTSNTRWKIFCCYKETWTIQTYFNTLSCLTWFIATDTVALQNHLILLWNKIANSRMMMNLGFHKAINLDVYMSSIAIWESELWARTTGYDQITSWTDHFP